MLVATLIVCRSKTADNTVAVAVCINYIMTLGDLMCGFLHNVGNLEKTMVSVKRCFKLLEIPQENLDQPRHEDESWPQKGEIVLKDVELKYRPKTELVLKKLSFNIKGGSKIGVVGRTGAGKSTLSLALTRVVELQGGSIEIDGVNIGDINLRQVRENVTIIPQDPTLYKGSLRYNLDPSERVSDARMIELLK